MPARTFATLLLIVIAAAALTVFLLLGTGLPVGGIGLVAAGLAAVLHLWPRQP